MTLLAPRSVDSPLAPDLRLERCNHVFGTAQTASVPPRRFSCMRPKHQVPTVRERVTQQKAFDDVLLSCTQPRRPHQALQG